MKGDRALILTDLDSLMAIFRWGKLESKLDQKLKLWVSPVTVKIWVLQNALNSICTTMKATCGQNVTSIRHCLLQVLPQENPKWGQMTLEPKKCSDFFWQNSKATKIQRLKLDNEKVKMDSPIIGYVRICDDPLTHVLFFYQSTLNTFFQTKTENKNLKKFIKKQLAKHYITLLPFLIFSQ